MQKQVIEAILELETRMFMQIRTSGTADCRENISAFTLHRKAQFSAWSLATCQSYLKDLQKSEQRGINLLTIKYARMENLIPPYSENPHIGWIVDIFTEWQQEMQNAFPKSLRESRPIHDFRIYLQSELETYSDATIALLVQDIAHSRENNRNMSFVLYQNLAKLAGFDSIQTMEQMLVDNKV
ncbi:MAG: DUF4125 family protein [Clostridia bacterium]|nr:DUF4125 family protein [Clostridia bacterium]